MLAFLSLHFSTESIMKKMEIPQEDFYSILEISSDAAPDAIKRSYFRLVRQHTPEKDPQGFERIRKAYETLHDPKRRAEYDALQRYGEEIRQLIDEAEALLKEEKWQLALRCLKQCLALYPGARYPRQLLTLTQLNLEHFALARKTLEPLLLEEPEDAEHHDLLGQIAFSEALQQKKPDTQKTLLQEAITAFQKAHQIQPKHPSYLLRLARAYKEAELYDQEIDCLKRALVPAAQIHSNNDLDIYLRLITSCLLRKREQDFQDATQQLRAVAQQLDQNKELPRVHFYLGHQLSQIGIEAYKAELFQQAAQLLSLADQLDPTENYAKMAQISEKHDIVAKEHLLWFNDESIPPAFRAFFHASFVEHISFEENKQLEIIQEKALETIGGFSVGDTDKTLQRFQSLYPNTSQHFANFFDNISQIIRTIRNHPPQGVYAWQVNSLSLLQAKHHNETYAPRSSSPTTSPRPQTSTAISSSPQQTNTPSTLPAPPTPTTPAPKQNNGWALSCAVIGAFVGLSVGPSGFFGGLILGYFIGLCIDDK